MFKEMAAMDFFFNKLVSSEALIKDVRSQFFCLKTPSSVYFD